jgi:hypothetical protein
MSLAAMTHLVEGLNLGTLLMLKVEVSNFLSGYTETNSIQNRTTVNFVLADVHK